jgi:hypothetical protein
MPPDGIRGVRRTFRWRHSGDAPVTMEVWLCHVEMEQGQRDKIPPQGRALDVGWGAVV